MGRTLRLGALLFLATVLIPLAIGAIAPLLKPYTATYPGGRTFDRPDGISEDLDRGVGELLGKLDDLKLADRTHVIYMSDNGSSTRSVLRGGKGGVWEGGIRVPLILRGPGIAANSWCHERVVGYDLFPTFCEWGGVTRALPPEIEGGSILPLLGGGTSPVKRARKELVFHFPHYQGDTPQTALLLGDLKLLHFYEDDSLQLYDLSRDIGETTDLAPSRQEKVGEMKALMDAYLDDVHAQFPAPNPHYDPANPPPLREKKNGAKGKGRTP